MAEPLDPETVRKIEHTRQQRELRQRASGAPKDRADLSPVARTSAGLREALFDQLDALRRGQSDAKEASAVAKLSSAIVETVRMEIEVARHKAAMRSTKNPADLESINESLRLGEK